MEVVAVEEATLAFVEVEDVVAVVVAAEAGEVEDRVVAAEEVGVNHYNHQAAAEH